MLFKFHPSMPEALTDPNRMDITRQAVERIVMAQEYGNHLFFAESDTLELLINSQIFNGVVKSNLLHALNHNDQRGPLFQQFKSWIEVVGIEGVSEINQTSDSYVIKISPEVVMNSRITERAILLCEDINDCKLYSKIGDVHIWDQRLSRIIRLDFDAVGGGGNRTSEQYDSFQTQRQKLCFCIIDTDFKYRGDSIGETASRIRCVHERNMNCGQGKQGIFCDYYLINAREIENIIPNTIFYEIIEGNAPRQSFLNWLEQLEPVNPESRLYLDFKEGFRLKEMIISRNPIMIEFWLSQVRFLLNSCRYLQGEECSDNCVCIDISGMGDHLLENAYKIISKTTAQKLKEAIISNRILLDIWSDIGENLLYWFCAPTPHSVN